MVAEPDIGLLAACPCALERDRGAGKGQWKRHDMSMVAGRISMLKGDPWRPSVRKAQTVECDGHCLHPLRAVQPHALGQRDHDVQGLDWCRPWDRFQASLCPAGSQPWHGPAEELRL